MRNASILTIVFVAVACISASATIINIPDDYPTIQEGIDASTDGDTVLVQPDTYVENINFNGHNITVGSLFLTTGDSLFSISSLLRTQRILVISIGYTGECWSSLSMIGAI